MYLIYSDRIDVAVKEDLKFRPVKLNNRKVEDEYKYLNILGTGSFGQVRKAEHLKTGELRAIKIVYKRDFTIREKREMLQEVKILSELDHPNIIKVYEYFEDSKYIYIVMELC